MNSSRSLRTADFGGADVVLEVQLANALAEEDVDIEVVDELEAAVVALEEIETVVVEGVGLDVFGGGLARATRFFISAAELSV